MQAHAEAVHHQAAATYRYGNFQETSSMVLFAICVIIILDPKQFLGSSVSYL